MTQHPPIFQLMQAQSLPEQVVAELKNAFFSGQFKPGDPIVERHLARQMGVGTPVVREALIELSMEGFVRRVPNKGTYATKFTAKEVEHLYSLRVEMESIALQWAKQRVQPSDIREMRQLVDRLVEAGEGGNRRVFLERDMAFHSYYWELSGNPFLVETLVRLMSPLFAFSVLGSGAPLTADMAREHYGIVDALSDLEEPWFTERIRSILRRFAARWIELNRTPLEDSLRPST